MFVAKLTHKHFDHPGHYLGACKATNRNPFYPVAVCIEDVTLSAVFKTAERAIEMGELFRRTPLWNVEAIEVQSLTQKALAATAPMNTQDEGENS